PASYSAIGLPATVQTADVLDVKSDGVATRTHAADAIGFEPAVVMLTRPPVSAASAAPIENHVWLSSDPWNWMVASKVPPAARATVEGSRSPMYTPAPGAEVPVATGMLRTASSFEDMLVSFPYAETRSTSIAHEFGRRTWSCG